MCYGSCPVYSVIILGDGTVEWIGRRYVQEEGARAWCISPDKIAELEVVIEKAKFADLDDEYTMHITSCSSYVYTTVAFEDFSLKRVKHYHGDSTAPSVLRWLENKIDEISGTKMYIGRSQ